MLANNDLGASIYAKWSDKRKKAEIEHLVTGFRNGLPIGVLLKMSETIAGDEKKASKLLKKLLSPEERHNAINEAQGGLKPLIESYLS